MSGAASEKVPQTNKDVRDLALSYRLIPEIVAYDAIRTNTPSPGMYDPDWTNWTAYTNSANASEWQSRSNFWMIAKNMHANMSELRLIFRWPLLPNGNAGNRRQVFRTVTGGHLLYTNDWFVPQRPLYFFEPRNYVKAP